MTRFTTQRLQWLIGCTLVLQSTDPIQTIVHYFFAKPAISPPSVYHAWLVFNIVALAFRVTAGYLFLFRSPAIGIRVATFVFLGFRTVIKLFSVPLFLLRWHEGFLQAARADNIADGLMTGAVVCCVGALVISPKNDPNQMEEPTRTVVTPSVGAGDRASGARGST